MKYVKKNNQLDFEGFTAYYKEVMGGYSNEDMVSY